MKHLNGGYSLLKLSTIFSLTDERSIENDEDLKKLKKVIEDYNSKPLFLSCILENYGEINSFVIATFSKSTGVTSLNIFANTDSFSFAIESYIDSDGIHALYRFKEV